MKRIDEGNLVSDAGISRTPGSALLLALRSVFPEIFPRFVFRAALSRWENLQWGLAEYFASLEAQRAFNRVPAYRRHAGSMPEGFADLPITSKANYIKPSLNHPSEIYLDGVIPPGCIVTSSTGTTGTPTVWYTGRRETYGNRAVLQNRLMAVLGNRPFVLVNGFALGMWASGMMLQEAMSCFPNATVYPVGADVQMIVSMIRKARSERRGEPIVVAGYPPHMEEVVTLCRQQGISLGSQLTIAVVGGEPMSEQLRDRIMGVGGPSDQSDGFEQVVSCYGASDLNINLAGETPYATALRRAMCHDDRIAAQLLPNRPGHVPMVFEFDPLLQLIEIVDGRIVVTPNVGDRVSPRVRYDTGDVGDVRRRSEVQAVLDNLEIDLGVRSAFPMPLLFVWGRIDDIVIFNGANVGWTDLQYALAMAGLSDSVREYGILQTPDEPTYTDFLVHAISREAYERMCGSGQILLQSIIDRLCSANQDFAYQLERASVKPRLRVFRDESPMSRSAKNENRHRKVPRIFTHAVAEDALGVEAGGTLFTVD